MDQGLLVFKTKRVFWTAFLLIAAHPCGIFFINSCYTEYVYVLTIWKRNTTLNEANFVDNLSNISKVYLLVFGRRKMELDNTLLQSIIVNQLFL